MNQISRRASLKMLGLASFAVLLPYDLFSANTQEQCDVCKKAWEGLHKFTRTRYEFRYIEPTANLPKVLLYGDSISIGYTEYVREALTGKADVYRIYENGQSSHDFINKMEVLRKTMFEPTLKGGWNFDWDVIHFNVGLHDLKYLDGTKLDKVKGTQVSSLEVYEKNLRDIIKYLKTTYPKAKLIFATTTPVPEGEEGRVAGDSVRYNEVALKVLSENKDIAINDLYTFSIPVQKKYSRGPGNVHYTDAGSRLQAIETAAIIATALNTKPGNCPSVEIVTKKFKEYESTKSTVDKLKK